jgi:vacuolar-type H+-ATPase subunit I/STV1
MCHLITWYYSLCLHDDSGSITKVPCAKALRRGYECVEKYENEFNLPMTGKCLECKMKQLVSRQNLIRTLKTRQRLAEINAAVGYSEEEEYCTSDSEPESESEVDSTMPSYRSSTPSIPTDTVEKLEEWAEIRDGLAQKTALVIPTSPIVSYNTLIEYVEDRHEEKDEEESSEEEEEEEEGEEEGEEDERISRWRSWIPLPTRLLQRRFYLKVTSASVRGGTVN